MDKINKQEIVEKIVNYILENKEKIIRYSLIIFICIFTILIAYFGFKAYSSYNIINSKIANYEVVNNPKIIKDIKRDNLRTIYSLTNTINFVYNKKYTEKYIGKVIIKNMINNDINVDIISSILLNFNKLAKTNKIENNVSLNDIISSIDDDDKLLNLLKNPEYVAVVKENYNDLLSLAILRKYISSFPKIRLSDKSISDVLGKLYIYEIVFIKEGLNIEYKKFENKFKKYQTPYNLFLTNIFFPSINIWEDRFSGKINPNLFGSDYLNEANYIDINLMSYWSDFFKYPYTFKIANGNDNEANDTINGFDTNKIKDISLGKNFKSNEKLGNNLIKIPINISFISNTDRSFYGIIAKLTSTSNIKNLMLISEFTYYVWKNIKENLQAILDKKIAERQEEIGKEKTELNNWYKEELKSIDKNDKLALDKLKLRFTKKNDILSYKETYGYNYLGYIINNCISDMRDPNCKKFFGRKLFKKIIGTYKRAKDKQDLVTVYNIIRKKFKNIEEFDKSLFNKFFYNEYYKINDIDKLIGAMLTECVKGDYCSILTNNTKGDVVVSAIEDFAKCNKGAIYSCINGTNEKDVSNCNICRNKFVDKFGSNYFIPYTFVANLDDISNSTFVDRFKKVYSNILGLLELGKFNFKRNDIENGGGFTASVSLNVYYKYISSDDINRILSHIGKNNCLNITHGKYFTLDIAHTYIKNKINNLYNEDLGADETYKFKQLKELINKFRKSYKKDSNLDKLLSVLQVYRIFLERGYCSE